MKVCLCISDLFGLASLLREVSKSYPKALVWENFSKTPEIFVMEWYNIFLSKLSFWFFRASIFSCNLDYSDLKKVCTFGYRSATIKHTPVINDITQKYYALCLFDVLDFAVCIFFWKICVGRLLFTSTNMFIFLTLKQK